MNIKEIVTPFYTKCLTVNAGTDPASVMGNILADARGEAHQQEFEVECEITGLGLKTRGIGVSRRAAEQQSAQRALELLPK